MSDYPVVACRLARSKDHGGALRPTISMRTFSWAQMQKWLYSSRNRRSRGRKWLWVEEEMRPAVSVKLRRG